MQPISNADLPSNTVIVPQNKKYVKGILLVALLILGAGSLLSYKLAQKDHGDEDIQAESLETTDDLSLTGSEQYDEDISVEERSRRYFVSEVYPEYPALSSEFLPEQVAAVFVFDNGTSWIVDANKGEEGHNHYLITPQMQKLLETSDITNDPSSNGKTFCRIQGVSFININEYAVVTGYCDGYGGGDFVSTYEIATGAKIQFKADAKNELVENGTATGRLLTVQGSTVVVQYGVFEGAAREHTQIQKYAFFDLNSGNLVDTFIFNP